MIYFVYYKCSIKHMHMQKPLEWLFANNVCIKMINIDLIGLSIAINLNP